MLEHKSFVWGMLGMLMFFGMVNALPYLIRAQSATAVRFKVVEVTRENGSPMDFVAKTGSLGRELARGVADFFGVKQRGDEQYETFIAELLLENDSYFDLNLLEVSFLMRIAGVDAVTGSFQRQQPLSFPSGGEASLYLPFTPSLEPYRFGRLIEGNLKAVVTGEAWLAIGNHKIKIDFEREMDLSQFHL